MGGMHARNVDALSGFYKRAPYFFMLSEVGLFSQLGSQLLMFRVLAGFVRGPGSACALSIS